MKKILLCANTSWNVINFRSGIISRFLADGYKVIIAAPKDDYTERLFQMGCEFRETAMNGHSRNVSKEILLFFRYLLLLCHERPNFVLCFTVKPNVYMSLAARLLGIKYVNNITGVGVNLRNDSNTSRILKLLYKLALKSSRKVFFQNLEDKQYFIENKLVSEKITDALPGSGINLDGFYYLERQKKIDVNFLMVARLLKEKGVAEYCNAARVVSSTNSNVTFSLLGPLVESSPSALSKAELTKLCDESGVQYLGQTDNVRPYLYKSSCIILPSYYGEGVPRSLLEAAASGLPIITTNEIGCRDAVDDGITGFICAARDFYDLSEKIMSFLDLSFEERRLMGFKGREKMEREFDEKIVVEQYLKVIPT